MSRFYITTSIPYVNGEPHLGHALELVQADVLARHRRLRSREVRFLTGTDDNALKNVRAAENAGLPVDVFVRRNADRFAGLRGPLQLSNDDFIRTSVDPRHRIGVERLWRRCAAAGDLYERDYRGLYCTGCEAFLTAAELVDGRCLEHRTTAEEVSERNWFFRLSRYEGRLRALILDGTLRIEPEHRRNEALSLVTGGLADFSVSRSRERARGWGIPVPGDPGQVVYVWFDALANYVTALEYGAGGDLYARWWCGAGERVHVIGKGILRFHAVYWPAILLSAGEPLPSAILVHDYLTAGGRKLGKSLGNAVAPETLVDHYGSDALRWWLLRDVPRAGDTDFREELLVARANAELADGLGNLVGRVSGLARRYGTAARVAEAPRGAANPLLERVQALPAEIDAAVERFDLREATDALVAVVAEANRFLSTTRPWQAAREGGGELDCTLAALVYTCRRLAEELGPFLPDASERIATLLAALAHAPSGVLFPKLRLDGAEALTQGVRPP